MAVMDGAAPLSIGEHIENLRVEGARLGEVAARTDCDAAVPSCPGWVMGDLLRHVGDVHRWAATIVRQRLLTPLHRDFHGPQSPGELLKWYGEGHAELLAALGGASPEDEFWAWAPAPNALAFWARRQAHETAIHRLDAEQAGGQGTRFDARQAADGISEWLTIASQRIKATSGGGRVLRLAALEGPGEWLVELRDDGIRVQGGESAGDCTVRAAASDLFALVMNRREAAGLPVDGDPGVLRAWRESVRF
jgi:uncharacterized protein (TIGR03083 family)